jgi:hypothetical protein
LELPTPNVTDSKLFSDSAKRCPACGCPREYATNLSNEVASNNKEENKVPPSIIKHNNEINDSESQRFQNYIKDKLDYLYAFAVKTAKYLILIFLIGMVICFYNTSNQGKNTQVQQTASKEKDFPGRDFSNRKLASVYVFRELYNAWENEDAYQCVEALIKWDKSMNLHNISLLTEVYASNVNYCGTSYSKNQIVSKLQEYLATNSTYEQAVSNILITSVNGNMNIKFDRLIRFSSSDGGQKYTYSMIFKEIDGEWKIISETTTSSEEAEIN